MRVRYLHTHGRHCCLMFDKGFANCQIHMRQAQSANYAFLYIGLRIPTPVGVSSLAFRRCKARLHCPKGANCFESRCKYRINLRFSQRKASKNAGGRTKSIKITFLREENEKNEGREKAAKRENMFHSQSNTDYIFSGVVGDALIYYFDVKAVGSMPKSSWLPLTEGGRQQ